MIPEVDGQPARKGARQGSFLHLESQISNLSAILSMENSSDPRILKYTPVPWFLLPSLWSIRETGVFEDLLESENADNKREGDLKADNGKEILGTALISLKVLKASDCRICHKTTKLDLVSCIRWDALLTILSVS